jgi:hypothetical protein
MTSAVVAELMRAVEEEVVFMGVAFRELRVGRSQLRLPQSRDRGLQESTHLTILRTWVSPPAHRSRSPEMSSGPATLRASEYSVATFMPNTPSNTVTNGSRSVTEHRLCACWGDCRHRVRALGAVRSLPNDERYAMARLRDRRIGRFRESSKSHCGGRRGGASAEPAEPSHRYDCVVDGFPFALLLWLGGRVGWEEVGLDISGSQPEIGRTFRR